MRVLVAEDDAQSREILEIFSRGADYQLVFAEDGGRAIEMFKTLGADVVVTDIRMPVADGEQVLKAVLDENPAVPVLIMTAHGSIEDAVRLLRNGAADYITKPITKEVFNHRLERALEAVRLNQEIMRLRSVRASAASQQIIGSSPQMAKVLAKLPLSAQTDAAVIVYGESGTGKELIAATLHRMSKRAEQPFITVNCGALPDTLLESELFGYKRGAFTDAHRDTPGLVEEANGGTLFLDEIGDLSLPVQVKLLRFLQSKEYKPLGSPHLRHADLRIVTATNRDLRAMVQQGAFREDLYYRLNIVPIQLPPLRERPADIPLLANHFLLRFRSEFEKPVESFSPEAMQRLIAHGWPGNVRELENKVQQAVVMAQKRVIEIADLLFEDEVTLFDVSSPSTFKAEKRRLVNEFEMRYIGRVLEMCQGNISAAARHAGMDRKNLWSIMRKHGIAAARIKGRGRRNANGEQTD
ncbi:MAG: sigma-54-dependent Fis family transcriptional regulator [Deltaproteobacteria bacterium]|nr:sigma-54-dependent Fis family transcriptional regulator [Deltaproteobacteria bacterium]